MAGKGVMLGQKSVKCELGSFLVCNLCWEYKCHVK
jgi:hypothetical protein